MFMLHKNAVFVGCARDCALYLPQVLANVARMASLFAESVFVFVENDSRDATKEQLTRWCGDRPNARLISLDGLATSQPSKTIRLAILRNQCLSQIRSEFSTFDYLFAVDCDDVNVQNIDLGAVRRAIDFLEQDVSHAGVFANSQPHYRDMWALRHPTRCPGDIWEEVCDYAFSHGVSDKEAFAQTFARRIFSLGLDSPPLEVDSAFGGLGIYKVPSVIKSKREYVGSRLKLLPGPQGPAEFGWQCCEHVAFHAGLSERGERLFILPFLVNVNYGPRSFGSNPSFWRSCLFEISTKGPKEGSQVLGQRPG